MCSNQEKSFTTFPLRRPASGRHLAPRTNNEADRGSVPSGPGIQKPDQAIEGENTNIAENPGSH